MPNKIQPKVVVLCVVVATTFWFFNAMNKQYTTNVAYSMQYHCSSKHLMLVSSPPSKIKINVSAIGWDLLKLNLGIGLEPYVFHLNEEQNKVIRNTALVSFIADELPNIKVNFVHEEKLRIKVDSILSKKVKIKPMLEIADENLIVINLAKSFPDKILVTGPRSFLDVLDEELSLSFTVEAPINASFTLPLHKELHQKLTPNVPEVNITYQTDWKEIK